MWALVIVSLVGATSARLQGARKDFLPHLYSKYSESSDAVLNSSAHEAFWQGREPLRGVLRRYITMHNGMMNGTYAPRVLRVRCRTQFGNQLLVTTASFVVALLTERALIIDKLGMDGEHVAMTNVLLPPSFNWSAVPPGESRESTFLVDYGPPFTLPFKFHEEFLCGNLTALFPQTTLVIDSEQYFMPFLARNPVYSEALEFVFGENIFQPLAKFFLRPIPEVLEGAEQIANEFKGKYSIAIQVRAGQDFTNRFVPLFPYSECALRAAKSAPHSANLTRDVVFFIASDILSARKRLLELLQGYTVVFQKGRLIERKYIRSKLAPAKLLQGAIDFFAMLKCNHFVITGWSTYGAAAAGYNGVNPLIVTRGPSRKGVAGAKESPALSHMRVDGRNATRECKLNTSFQPCFRRIAYSGFLASTCADRKWVKAELSRYC